MLTDFHILETKDSIENFKVFLIGSAAYFAIHSFVLMFWHF